MMVGKTFNKIINEINALPSSRIVPLNIPEPEMLDAMISPMILVINIPMDRHAGRLNSRYMAIHDLDT